MIILVFVIGVASIIYSIIYEDDYVIIGYKETELDHIMEVEYLHQLDTEEELEIDNDLLE